MSDNKSFSEFCKEKIEMYQDMKELEEKAEDMIDTRVAALDHEPTSEEIDKITDDVWTELQSKE